MVFCRQQDRGDLGFVADFRHEKQKNRRPERAVFEPTAVGIFIFIGQEQPQADRDEADADRPFDGIGGNGFRQPYADKCGDQMIQ